MIYLAYLGESRGMEFSEDSKKYLIVRKPMGQVPKGFIFFPHLSPSSDLLENAQRWKAGNINRDEELFCLKSGISPRNSDAWWTLYEPLFLEELKTRKDIKEGLKIMKKESMNNDIYLFCYCKELERCHRVLIGEFLMENGLEVDFREVEEVEEETNKVSQICMF